MIRFIKYKRIDMELPVIELNKLFDDLITEGWEIINYKEEEIQYNINNEKTNLGKRDINYSHSNLHIIIIVGKKQNNVI